MPRPLAFPRTTRPLAFPRTRGPHTDPRWTSCGQRASIQGELEAYSRSWPVFALLAANVGVFAYFYVDQSPKARRVFSEHFVLSNSRFSRHAYVAVTSMFVHADPIHLAMNCFTLWGFGTASLDMLGPRRFLALYFVGGVAGSLSHLAYTKVMPRYGRAWAAGYTVRPDDAAIGASSGVTALVMYTATRLFRAQTILFILPVPNLIFVPLFLGGTLYYCLEGGQGGRFAHAAHLGGASVGVGYALTRALLRR
jgi:membrane associated rhomboid family serine protease